MTGKNAIFRSSEQRGGLSPEAVEILSCEFTAPLYYLDYQLRHPFGIYNVSLNQVISSFEGLIESLSSAKQHDLNSKKLDRKWDEELLQNLEKLLYSLMEHMDDCENIIQCFFPHGTKIFRESSVKTYHSVVDSYRTHIGKVVNHLKHRQGRLRSFGMLVDNIPHLGYFVEGISEDGSLGPAPHIHSNGTTAFSYARDIRFHLYNLYYVSVKLSEAIEAISSPDKNKTVFQLENKNTGLGKIIKSIAELPTIIFIDELQKDFR